MKTKSIYSFVLSIITAVLIFISGIMWTIHFIPALIIGITGFVLFIIIQIVFIKDIDSKITGEGINKISSGTEPPTGGEDGDVYFQYEMPPEIKKD